MSRSWKIGTHAVERGLFDLRRGRSLFVTTDTEDGRPAPRGVLVAAVECLDPSALECLRAMGGDLRLALTHHRALAMGVYSDPLPSTNGGAKMSTPWENGARRPDISIGLSRESTPEQILHQSSAMGKYAEPAGDVRPASAEEHGGLVLTRLSGLLPAVVAVRSDRATLAEALESTEVLEVTTGEVASFERERPIEVSQISEAPVPLEEAEDARFMLFREANGLLEHVAILIGDRESWPDPVPVRLHSACLTGDLFGSLRCDCGEQLRGALRVFEARGGGVLLYLAQEGRGIGLGNKLRAYALQQEGLDTVDADCALGFGADERRYDAAVEMLRHLGVERVHLLTNNPEKVRAVRQGGIRVAYRQPLHGTLNRHNLPYVRAKVQRAGHWLGDMLSGASPGE